MKCLYISTLKLPHQNEFKEEVISDYMYRDTRFFCTKLKKIERNQIRFDFILKTYKFTNLLAHITHEEIPIFLEWRDRFFPNMETIVNIYCTYDKSESLYLLGTDMNLDITGYFFKTIEPVFALITPMTSVSSVNNY